MISKGLNQDKIKAVLLDKFDRSKPDFGPVAQHLAQSSPQAVVFVAAGSHVVEGVKALRAAGVAAQIATLSNNASSGFVKLMGEQARGSIVTQVFPSERATNYPMIKEAQELARAKGLTELSPAMLEGYAAAKVLVEALRAAGKQPTREKVQAALEGMRKFDLGGLEVNFTPEDHTGMDFADLSIIGTDGKFRR